MGEKRLALVRWVGGDDDGDYTVGVPVAWIMNFSYEDWRHDTAAEPESYVIEWRQGKMPKQGWPVCDGIVLDIANTKTALQRTLKAIDGKQSLSRSFCDEPQRISSSVASSPKDTDEDSNDTVKVDSDSDESLVTPRKRCRQLLSDEESSPKRVNSSPPKSTDPILHQIMQAITQLTKDAANNQNSLKLLESKLRQQESPVVPSLEDRQLPPLKVEIGFKGSNVCINTAAWEVAQTANSGSRMTRTLLTAAFPESVLLESNYKGGKSKQANENSKQFKALDEKTVAAIKMEVLAKFPNFTSFGITVNQKLTQVRSSAKAAAAKAAAAKAAAAKAAAAKAAAAKAAAAIASAAKAAAAAQAADQAAAQAAAQATATTAPATGNAEEQRNQ